MIKYIKRLLERSSHGERGTSILVRTVPGVVIPPDVPPVDELPWTDLEPSIPIIKPPVSCAGAYNYVTLTLRNGTTNYTHANYSVELNGILFNSEHIDNILSQEFELGGYQFATYYGSDGTGTLTVNDSLDTSPIRVKLIPSIDLDDNNIFGITGGGEVRFIDNNKPIEFCLKPELKEEVLPPTLPVLTCASPDESIGFNLAANLSTKYHVTVNGGDYGDVDFAENGVRVLGPLTIDVSTVFGSDASGWFNMSLVSAGTASLPVRITFTPASDLDYINVEHVPDFNNSAIHDVNLKYLGFCLIEPVVEVIPSSTTIIPYWTGSDGYNNYHAKYRINGGEWNMFTSPHQPTDVVSTFLTSIRYNNMNMVSTRTSSSFIYDQDAYELRGLPVGENGIDVPIIMEFAVSPEIENSLDLIGHFGGNSIVMSRGRTGSHVISEDEQTIDYAAPMNISTKNTSLNATRSVPFKIEVVGYDCNWKLKSGDMLLADNLGSRVDHVVSYYENSWSTLVTVIEIYDNIGINADYSLYTDGSGIYVTGSPVAIGEINILSFAATAVEYKFSLGNTKLTVPTVLPKHITELTEFFSNSRNFNQDISMWDTSHITSFYKTFSNCMTYNKPLNTWDVSAAGTLCDMFENAAMFNQDLSAWTFKEGVVLTELFRGCSAFNQPINGWNMSNVSDVAFMFYEATAFNQPLNNWDLAHISSFSYMFYGATAFNQPLNNWVVSNSTSFNEMFKDAVSFDQDISSWNVANAHVAYNLGEMFSGAISFNQDLSQWCVPISDYSHYAFDENTPSWVKPKPVWGTCPRGEVPEPNHYTFNLMTTANKLSNDSLTITIFDYDSYRANVFNIYEDGVMIATSGYYDVNTVTLDNLTYMPARHASVITISPAAGSNHIYSIKLFNNVPIVEMTSTSSDSSAPGFIVDFVKFSDYAILHKFKMANIPLSVPSVIPRTLTSLTGMFSGSTLFNQDISTWDTSLVTNMNEMFNGATLFNQDLSSWNVKLIPSEPTNFKTNTVSWTLPKPVWGTEGGTEIEPTVPSLPDMTLPSDSINFTTTNHIGTSEAPVTITIEDAVGQWGLKRNGVLIANSSFNAVPGVVVGSADGVPVIRLAWDKSNPTDSVNQYELYVNANTVSIREGEASNSNADLTIELTKFNRLVKSHKFPVYYGNLVVPATLPTYITSTNGMFKNNEYFNGDITGWNMVNVTDTSEMFYAAASFNQPIGVWNVSNVTTMTSMFGSNFGFEADISGWNTSNVTNMDGMFYGTYFFNIDLSKWNVLRIAAEPYQFYNPSSNNWTFPKPVWGTNGLPALPLPQLIALPHPDAIDFTFDFYGRIGSVDRPLEISFGDENSTWSLSRGDTVIADSTGRTIDGVSISQYNDITFGFTDSLPREYSLRYIPSPSVTADINYVKVSKVGYDYAATTDSGFTITTFSSEFNSLRLLLPNTYIDVPVTLPKNITILSRMFSYCKLSNPDVTTWDVSHVTEAAYTFIDTRFNRNIGHWDVSNMLDMSSMLEKATSFNQDLSMWNVAHLPERPSAFDLGTTKWTLPKPVWGTNGQ